MVYLKFDPNNGEFVGFYNDEVPQHKNIIKESSLPMTAEAHDYFFKKHRQNMYKLDINKISEISIINKSDVDIIFIQKEPIKINYESETEKLKKEYDKKFNDLSEIINNLRG